MSFLTPTFNVRQTCKKSDVGGRKGRSFLMQMERRSFPRLVIFGLPNVECPYGNRKCAGLQPTTATWPSICTV